MVQKKSTKEKKKKIEEAMTHFLTEQTAGPTLDTWEG